MTPSPAGSFALPLLPSWPVWLIGIASLCHPVSPAAAESNPEPVVLVHYMPWYATKPVSGQWGWHWTMGRFNPERRLADGRREVASHDYPLIDLYDSGDDRALECQVLLMKIAGVDGVIVDWYGLADFNDYAAIHRNTGRLIPWLKRAGLRFAVCYEDQSVGHMIRGGALAPADAVAHGRQTLRWLEEHWFGDAAYVKEDGRPVLLVFGPQYFQRDDWRALRSGLASRPLLFALPHRAATADADGVFGWPPVTAGKEATPEQWRRELELLHQRRASGQPVIAVAFPGFRDIYREAGLHDSYGSIAARDGATFAESLDLALRSGSSLVQIATWNDYGEGTVIEPTRQHGYRYLEHLQTRVGDLRKPLPNFTAADLRLPVRLYQLRNRARENTDPMRSLDEAAELLFAGRCREAAALLDQLGAVGDREERGARVPE